MSYIDDTDDEVKYDKSKAVNVFDDMLCYSMHKNVNAIIMVYMHTQYRLNESRYRMMCKSR